MPDPAAAYDTVTCHLGKGEHVTSVMHRSKPPEDDDNDDDDVENCTSESDYDSHSLQPSFESALDMPTSTHWDELPSHHSIKQRAAEEAWKGVRHALRCAVVQSNCMPPHQMCVLCQQQEASFRCNDCSAFAYYCSSCLQNVHDTTCVLHTPEEWKDGTFSPVNCVTSLDI
ncbi:PREDICTED: uncharacterized protein LOC109592077, partial [Amphimedon queenslandica]|uniref:Uncharacterized protein n=2 Tax=Amphimedon queenslandica TaxID=400682 RepID=A0AAN0K115_AMPQE